MCVYKQFCNETFDENGRLKKITLDYPDNFNFGYDVVDKIADDTAIRWRMSSAMQGSAAATGSC